MTPLSGLMSSMSFAQHQLQVGKLTTTRTKYSQLTMTPLSGLMSSMSFTQQLRTPFISSTPLQPRSCTPSKC